MVCRETSNIDFSWEKPDLVLRGKHTFAAALMSLKVLTFMVISLHSNWEYNKCKDIKSAHEISGLNLLEVNKETIAVFFLLSVHLEAVLCLQISTIVQRVDFFFEFFILSHHRCLGSLEISWGDRGKVYHCSHLTLSWGHFNPRGCLVKPLTR